MVAIPLPTTSMPGQYQQESGGRLINAFVESLGEGAASKFALRRVPGMLEFGTTAQAGFRGGIQVGSLTYSAWSGKVVTHTSSGGAGSTLTGNLTGTDGVFWARNNAATPNVVAVSPANGAFEVSTAAVVAFVDTDVGSPNSVVDVANYFIFGYGNGKLQASGLNAVSINTLDSAFAESKPDTLYRVSRRGRTLLAVGSGSIEFWDLNNEGSGFPFSWTGTHDRGSIGRYAFAGEMDGWGYGHFFAADDFSVRHIDGGYDSTKISPPDLDRLIEAVVDKQTIKVSVYVTQGHPWVCVQSDDWTWEYDVTLQRWHERQSYNLTRWKGSFPFKAFDKWVCGNIADGSNARLFSIETLTRTEDDEPLLCDVETGPAGASPNWISVDTLSILCAVGVGVASGADPIETDPSILIYISKDNGLTWSNPWVRKLGAQGQGLQRVTVNDLGHCGPQGMKLKFRISDPVHVGIMSVDADVTPLAA